MLVSYEGIKIKIVGALGKPWVTNVFPAFQKILYILYKQTFMKLLMFIHRNEEKVMCFSCKLRLLIFLAAFLQLKAHSSSFTTLYEDVNELNRYTDHYLP